MKKFKVAVEGIEQFNAAQAALFAMGFGWSSGGKQVQAYPSARQIYVDHMGYMSYSTDASYEVAADQVLWLTKEGQLVEAELVHFAKTKEEAEAAEVPRMARHVAMSRGTDPITSKAAGMSFDPTQLELEVLNAIRSFGTEGATQDDVLTKLRRISHSSITPRFRPLLNKGLVNDSGLKRKGVSGRSQRVMVAAA